MLLSDINSAHTAKWVLSLVKHGVEVALFSLNPNNSDWNKELQGLTLFLEHSGEKSETGLVSKLSYLKSVPYLKRSIKSFNPHVVHAHYASSYGLLGALSGFRPFFISVWGSDITQFPQSGFLNKQIIRYNLRRANKVFATSTMLKQAVKSQFGIDAIIIPFGIDTSVFVSGRAENIFPANTLVIGTVKALEAIYRIDWLIKAFALAQTKRADLNLRLLIVGSGSLEGELKNLARTLCKEGTCIFTGKVQYELIPQMHRQLDIFVHTALNESFGVSTLEAAACEKPVVACNSGGTSEVVEAGTSALLYSANDFDDLVLHILTLIDNKALRQQMGMSGRAFVCKQYDWEKNVQQMIDEYKSVAG
jgi:L-malate glycosyltransferase